MLQWWAHTNSASMWHNCKNQVLLVWTKALKHWNMIWMIHYIWMDKFDYEQYIWHEWYVNDMKSDTIETARSNDMWNDLDDMIDTNNMWMIVWCYLIQLTMWNWSREHIDTIETIDTIQLICEWYWCYYCYCFYHYLIQLIWWMNWKQDNIENTIDQYMDQRQAVSRKDH